MDTRKKIIDHSHPKKKSAPRTKKTDDAPKKTRKTTTKSKATTTKKEHPLRTTPKRKSYRKNATVAKGSKRKTTKRTTAKKKGKKSNALSFNIHWKIKYTLVMAFVATVIFYSFYIFCIKKYEYRWKSCPGRKEYSICMPYGFKVHGIDISHHQGNINWKEFNLNKQKKFPLSFIFMKATEGGDHRDKKFNTNFNNAKANGFIRGAYHFFNPNSDPLRQADFFIKTVALKKGDLPPVLDIERKGRKNKEELQRAVMLWLKRVEGHYKVKPIIYSSYKFKKRYLNTSALNSYPFWIAHYYVDSLKYKNRWHFWQHTDIGQVKGIDEDVDLNVFNGSLEDLKALTIQEE